MKKTRSAKPKKPRTAYDLCELVAQHIEEEPRRYNQRSWASFTRIRERFGHAAPACKTACCRAGWLVALADGVRAKPLVRASRLGWDPGAIVATRANEILGVDVRATARLFQSDALSTETGHFDLPEFGSADYAALGAAGLRAWAKRHARRLKARLLKDVPKLT